MASQRCHPLINISDVPPQGVGQIARGVIELAGDVGERQA
jgi:hypothetical protein